MPDSALRGLKQVANHRAQLVYAPQNRTQVFALLLAHRAGQAIEQDSDELMNAGERCAQLVRYVRQKLVLELELLLPAYFERSQQRLALNCVPHGAIELAVAEVAFDEIVLHALVKRFDRQPLIVLPRENDYRNFGCLGQHPAKCLRTLAVGEIQVEQHERRRFAVKQGQAVR